MTSLLTFQNWRVCGGGASPLASPHKMEAYVAILVQKLIPLCSINGGSVVHATVYKNSKIKTCKVTWVLLSKAMSLFFKPSERSVNFEM